MKVTFLCIVVAVWCCGCATSQTRALQHNRGIIQRYFDGWANRGDPAVADALIATNLVLHNPPAVLRSLEAYQQSMAAFHRAFPDLHFTVEDLVAERDRVVVRWTLRGTQRGEYQGHPATGKPMTVTGMSLFRLADGKIQEIHVSMDRFGMQQQLGWLPARITALLHLPPEQACTSLAEARRHELP